MTTAAGEKRDDVDWEDLEGKVQALMRFAAALTAGGGGVDGRNRYEDCLRVSFHGTSRRAKKTVDLLWFCPGLGSFKDRDLPVECREDRRDHEGLLRAFFSEYRLLFYRGPGFRHVMIADNDHFFVDGAVSQKLWKWQLARDLAAAEWAAEAAEEADKKKAEKEEEEEEEEEKEEEGAKKPPPLSPSPQR